MFDSILYVRPCSVGWYHIDTWTMLNSANSCKLSIGIHCYNLDYDSKPGAATATVWQK